MVLMMLGRKRYLDGLVSEVRFDVNHQSFFEVSEGEVRFIIRSTLEKKVHKIIDGA